MNRTVVRMSGRQRGIWGLKEMAKALSEMTLEELWELFPIFLVEHDDRWKDCYNEIERRLRNLFTGWPVHRISHIGSTAIAGIWAKNIIDVMVELPESSSLDDAAQILEQNGFIIMSAEANRISLNKGYTPDGFADKVYHVPLLCVAQTKRKHGLVERECCNPGTEDHPVPEYPRLLVRACGFFFCPTH